MKMKIHRENRSRPSDRLFPSINIFSLINTLGALINSSCRRSAMIVDRSCVVGVRRPRDAKSRRAKIISRASFERTFAKCGTKEKSLKLNSIEKKKKIFYFYLFSPKRKILFRGRFHTFFRSFKGFFGCGPPSKRILFN